MSPEARYSTLRDYLAVIRQRRVTIVLVTLLFGAVAFATTVGKDPVYESEAAIIVRDPSSGIGTIGVAELNREQPVERAVTFAETVTRKQILDAASRRLGGRIDLSGKVSGRAEVRTNFVVIVGRDDDAAMSARIAQAVAEEVVTRRRRDVDEYFDRIVRRVRLRLRQEVRGSADLAKLARAEFEQQLVRIRAARDVSDPAEIAREARVPATPVSPKPVRTTIIGLLVGLTMSLLLAFLRDSLDRRLRGARDVADVAGLPLLGLVRDHAMGKANIGDPSGKGDQEIDFEAFRIVRMNLEFLDIDRSLKSVVVTSPLPGEGKSTVAASLAVASALAGKRVLLVEADLRRPVLASRFGLEPGPGLTDHLAGRAGPADILRTIPLTPAPSVNGDGDTEGGEPRLPLVVITAGTVVPRPAELLASERFATLVREVTEAYDLVVFDSSPLLPVVDTLELIPRVDSVIMCVRSGQTTRDQLTAATQALKRLPDRPTGIVVTGVKKRDTGEYGYYSYSYDYGVRS